MVAATGFHLPAQGREILQALDEPAARGGEVAIHFEKYLQRVAEAFRHRRVVIVLRQAFQLGERRAPAGFQLGDALEIGFQTLRLRPCRQQRHRQRLTLDELAQAAFPPVGEVMDGAERRQLQAAAVGLGDEIPERTAQGRRVRATFEIGAVKKLDDRLADVAGARHCGAFYGWRCEAWSGRVPGKYQSSRRRPARLPGRG